MAKSSSKPLKIGGHVVQQISIGKHTLGQIAINDHITVVFQIKGGVSKINSGCFTE